MRKVRNRYGFTLIDVQQQAAAKESLESFKLEKLEPSPEGLGETKLTQRKADLILGLFSPALHEIKNYRGYSIEKLRDNYRNLSILRNRYGLSALSIGLFFNGAVNYFEELPKSEDFKTNPNLYDYYVKASEGFLGNNSQKKLLL
jgi:hypothetical protein